LLQGRKLRHRDAIRESGTALVEVDQPGEAREPPQEASEVRALPQQIEMIRPAPDQDHVVRLVTEHLIGQMHVAVSRRSDLRYVGHG
jgi:hypothetical protein